MSLWGWVLIGWALLAIVAAVPLGLAMREADRRDRRRRLAPASVPVTGPPPPIAVAVRRRRIPVPPVGILLATTGVALEALGFVLRSTGADRTGSARLLSMDAPLSVPRMFITALFLVAALAAFAGAARATVRRPWWVAVGLVALVVAEVKGGGTVHVRVLEALGVADHPGLAFAGSALVLAVVLSGLWWVTRTERRDRRRVLLAITFYGAAATGLSALSTVVATASGATSSWTAAATFVEESAEVLGGVAVLLAVLVGVAPRLVLPADWALRRTADAETVDAPGAVPGLAHGHRRGADR
jgi:hypothetical protein